MKHTVSTSAHDARRTTFDPSQDRAYGIAARFGAVSGSVLIALGLAGCGAIDHNAWSTNDAAATAAPIQIDATETAAPNPQTTGVASRTGVANAASTSGGTTATGSTTPSRTTTTTTTAVTTTVAPASVTTASAKINSLDTIVDDMRLGNDLVLRGYESRTVGWYVGPGYNMMGNDGRTTNTPQWWKNAYPWLVNDTYLNRLLPWAVIFDGVGHSASNTRVQLRNFVAYYKSKSTGQWVSIGQSAGLSGFSTPKSDLFNGSIGEDKRTNADGSVEIKPPSDINYAWHGWWGNGRAPIPAADVAAIHVSLQARLVVDNPGLPDDRAAARLLVWAGSDYYGESSWTVPNPAAAASRIKRVTNDWQAFNATTLTDVGIQEPGGGITSAQLRAAPPPIQ